MPAPHLSVFYRPVALTTAQPTASKHWRRWKANRQVCKTKTAARFFISKTEMSWRRRMSWKSIPFSHSVLSLLTHTRLTALCPGQTRVSRYQKGKTNLDFTEAGNSEWQWHQLGRMQVCTSLQTDNHASTPLLSFFTGRMPFLPPNQQRQSTEGTVITTKFV